MTIDLFAGTCQMNGSQISRIFFNEDEGVLDLMITAGRDFWPGRIEEGRKITLHFTDVTSCSYDKRKFNGDRIVYTEFFSPTQVYLECVDAKDHCSSVYIHAASVQVIELVSCTACRPAAVCAS